MLNDLYENKNS